MVNQKRKKKLYILLFHQTTVLVSFFYIFERKLNIKNFASYLKTILDLLIISKHFTGNYFYHLGQLDR